MTLSDRIAALFGPDRDYYADQIRRRIRLLNEDEPIRLGPEGWLGPEEVAERDTLSAALRARGL